LPGGCGTTPPRYNNSAVLVKPWEITLIGLDVLSVGKNHVSLAPDVSRQTGLLCGDAVVVAVMQAHGLVHLASNDADFDRVPGLTRYAPA
jgi:predicted nucleic acid-binding protein